VSPPIVLKQADRQAGLRGGMGGMGGMM